MNGYNYDDRCMLCTNGLPHMKEEHRTAINQATRQTNEPERYCEVCGDLIVGNGDKPYCSDPACIEVASGDAPDERYLRNVLSLN